MYYFQTMIVDRLQARYCGTLVVPEVYISARADVNFTVSRMAANNNSDSMVPVTIVLLPQLTVKQQKETCCDKRS